MVPVADLKRQYQALHTEIQEAIRPVLEEGSFIMGPRSKKLEDSLAAYCGVKHAIGVNSGTDAIYLALLSLGVGPGDDVVTTAYSMFATVEPIRLLGARPVFVDIDPKTFQIDVELCKSRVTKKTKAIIPVHLYGNVVNMKALLELSKSRGVPVVEDAAQAIGATYFGQKAGGLGEIGCMSFYPTKNLGGCGDGGMIFTNNDKLAEEIRLLRQHGQSGKYVHIRIGINSRLDDLQAAILSVKFKYIDQWNARRRQIADEYSKGLAETGIQVPVPQEGVVHTFHQYTIRAPKRDDLQKALTAKGVGSGVHYPVALPFQPALQDLGHQPGDFPQSEKASTEVLCLPMFPELTDEEVQTVVKAVREASLVSAKR